MQYDNISWPTRLL